MVGRSSITHEERLRPRIHAMPIGFNGRGDRSSIALHGRAARSRAGGPAARAQHAETDGPESPGRPRRPARPVLRRPGPLRPRVSEPTRGSGPNNLRKAPERRILDADPAGGSLPEQVAPGVLSQYDGLILDLDGVVWRGGAADIGLAWSKRGRGPPTGSARPRAREPRRVRQETYVAVIHKPYAQASRGGHPPPRRRHEPEPPSWKRRSATNVECG